MTWLALARSLSGWVQDTNSQLMSRGLGGGSWLQPVEYALAALGCAIPIRSGQPACQARQGRDRHRWDIDLPVLWHRRVSGPGSARFASASV